MARLSRQTRVQARAKIRTKARDKARARVKAVRVDQKAKAKKKKSRLQKRRDALKGKLIAVDFCTTACCRPKLLNKTYKSFTRNLLGIDYSKSTLYINIDPIPDGDRDEVIEVAKQYFGNVVANTPEKPNFSKALKWCFLQPKGDYFFYLQDDWVMQNELYISDMIKHLGTRHYPNGGRSNERRNSRTIVAVNLRAYKTIRDNRICLSPVLVSNSWGKRFAKRLNTDFNPERQTRIKSKKNPHGADANDLGASLHLPEKKVIVADTGRKWLNKNNIRRNGNAVKFNGWIKKKAKKK